MSSPGPYSIGSNHWPGLSKLIEESGEVGQVVGKLIATGGRAKHWEGSDLRERIQEELGDLVAACFFVMEANSLDEEAIRVRHQQKLALFHRWHVEQADSVPPSAIDREPRICSGCGLLEATATVTGICSAHGSGQHRWRTNQMNPRGGPDNFIDNCALACGEPISTCQMCPQACPDAHRFQKKEK